MSLQVVTALQKQFGPAILSTHDLHGDETVLVEAACWQEICLFLKDEPSLSMDRFVDLCGVDFPHRLPRMDIVLHLASLRHGHRVRVKARIGDEEMNGGEIDSLCSLWKAANWFEREVYDMMGVLFRGHPDLRRILLYPEFQGYPLRKDYPADRVQPLIPYRTEADAGLPLGKLAPFGADEGMSFGRIPTFPSEVP